MLEKKLVWILCLIGCFVFVQSGLASPSGLNNIPTADVVPENILVFQTWANLGPERSTDLFFGAKFGVYKGVEIGLDSEDSGPIVAQFKVQAPVFGPDSKLLPLVGVENISTDTDRAGDLNPYIVFTYDFDFLRGHVGYNFQDDNLGAFLGVDTTVQLGGRDLVLRADVRETSDGDELLGSLGFLHVLPENFVLEGWVSVPSDDGLEESYTIKLNYVLEF